MFSNHVPFTPPPSAIGLHEEHDLRLSDYVKMEYGGHRANLPEPKVQKSLAESFKWIFGLGSMVVFF